MKRTHDVKTAWRTLSRSLVLLLSFLFLCRATNGTAIFLLGGVGICAALSRRNGWAMVAFLLIPFLMVINPFLVPHGGGVAMFSRIITVLLAFSLVVGNLYHGNAEKREDLLPVSGIVLFLLSALISSIWGFFPLISYFKLLNFSVFLLGLYAGTAFLSSSPDDVLILRYAFLSLSILFVVGSLCALAFPAIAFFTSSSYYIVEEGLERANEYMSTDWQGMGLFSGITVHSQFLGPVLACFSCWLCCDLFLGNGENRLVHLFLLLCIPPMIFMSRSRAGLLAYAFSWIVLAFHFFPRLRVSAQRREKIFTWLLVGIVLLTAAGVFAQIRNRALSRWIRKTDDLANDSRNLAEAFTNSRKGLIARCLSEFNRNPWFGSGFQVVAEHRSAYQAGRISLFSAPLEKGILPLMVLGETGIVGFLLFVYFLFSFFSACYRRGYVATSTLSLVFLSTNMAESTFFSPSGGGGVMWGVCVLGGFTIDMAAKQRHMLRLASVAFPQYPPLPSNSIPLPSAAPAPILKASQPRLRPGVLPK